MQKEDQREDSFELLMKHRALQWCHCPSTVCRCNDYDADDSIPLTTGEYDEWGIQIRRSITTTCDRTHLMIT
jgi:hypothetical protein